ncbi:MAG: carbohydrate ABC transporter permease [Thermoplasmataceae archaeon]
MEVVFILPLLIFIGVLNIYPIIQGINLSFLLLGKYSLYNYYQLQSYSPSLYAVTVNTIVYVPFALAIEFFLALFTALLLNRAIRGRAAFRSIIMLPYGVATVVSAIAFSFVFSATNGYANEILIRMGILHSQVDWTSGYAAFFSIAVADSWKTFPLIMLILLGGLQMIPESQYEAAAIDGANQLQQFVRITLPNLYPFIMIAMIIRAVSEFNILSLPLILVGSNVQFLGTLSFNLYETFSLGSANISAAVATVLLSLVMVFVLVYIYVSGKLGSGSR